MLVDKQRTIDVLRGWLTETAPPDARLLVPVSGGSDSSFCFWLCNQELGRATLGVYVGTGLRRRDWLDGIGDLIVSGVDYGDVNPEIRRWALFLGMALAEDRILVGSRNLTEQTLGTFSNASRVAALLPLSGLWKHQVMELCEYVGVPEEIIASSRHADPECGRPQELADIPYGVVDGFLCEKLGLTVGGGLGRASVEQSDYLEALYAKYSYKSRLPMHGPAAMVHHTS
jgi:NH3-dependent NAD+ synthetase